MKYQYIKYLEYLDNLPPCHISFNSSVEDAKFNIEDISKNKDDIIFYLKYLYHTYMGFNNITIFNFENFIRLEKVKMIKSWKLLHRQIYLKKLLNQL